VKKNAASQKIGAQMVSATDGSAFTGSVTVYVTGDAGTQAVGSVGSGACTHEGNGYHTYSPAQAETNYDLIAFTFTGSGAIPATVQVFTSYPQTGDSYTEITNGTYGLSALETLVDGVETALATAQADLDTITGSDGVALASTQQSITFQPIVVTAGDAVANITLSGSGSADGLAFTRSGSGGLFNTDWAAAVQQEAADALTAYDPPTNTEMVAAFTQIKGATWSSGTDTLELIRDKLSDIETDTAEIGAAGAGLTALATQTSVNTIDDFLDTEIAAIKAVTDSIGSTGTGLTAIPWNASWDAEVQSECADALNAYDPPTNAEMEARTPTAAQLAYIVSNSADGVPVTFTGGTTTTAILGTVDGAAASSTDDYYNGRVLVFNAGTLDMQATDITDYVGSTKTATITAVTTAVTSSHTANLK
jgi:hypothetical protein